MECTKIKFINFKQCPNFQHCRDNWVAAGRRCMEGKVTSESGLPASVHDLRESPF